jgi:hypothetical protein
MLVAVGLSCVSGRTLVTIRRGVKFFPPRSIRNTTDKLRSIPLAHIETLANTNPDFSPHIEGTEQHAIGKTFDQVGQQANKVLINEAYRKVREPRIPLSRQTAATQMLSTVKWLRRTGMLSKPHRR